MSLRRDRREFLFGLGATLGTVAFNAMLRGEEPRSDTGPLSPKPQQVPAKAKACIWLSMAGGPSHLDTFDPKPKLDELHLKEFQRQDKFASAMASGKRYYVKSPFRFRRVGESGLEMCEHFAHLAKVADELCVYKGCVAESIDHPTANYHINTGNRFGGDPAVGSWVSYGLGTLNADLPSFVVLPEVTYPQGGSANWSNGFLPAHHQGTPLRATGSPLLDLTPPGHVTRDDQRANLDLLASLNRDHHTRHPQHDELAARMESYELAYRMQSVVPDLIDLGQETQHTLDAYGLGVEPTDTFGRRCLLARRLIEKGVRFVQVYAEGWDSHDYLERSHSRRIEATDKPIAALIADLKQRGMLDETLVVWGGEFGRSPDNGIRSGGIAYGRDHNAKAMAMWMAGGGVRAGHVVGATDEIGASAVECVHPIRDLHVTILRLLGLDDNKLTYFYGGRFKQLSQIGGSAIPELIG
ncbi:MAG: DUF1501 domain-containing protein [Planctomycetaceae bacterium]|nr:DUF1501 domain-containing protein [Planctomycetaceae bacterium]